MFAVLLGVETHAQDSTQMVRIARIKVDPAQLDPYLQALSDQMNSAIRLEPGVLSYHAVADREDPSRITIMEVYASRAAYLSHIGTPHFMKYKERVKNMVQFLELTDVKTIGWMRK